MIPDTKIAIIGAGPAGASAAICLAQKGIEVNLYDKSEFPRDKVCGDALSLDVINQLQWISEPLYQKFQSAIPKAPSGGVSIISPGGERVDIPFKRNGEQKNGFVSKRIDFDALLVDEACKLPGVNFFPGTQLQKVERRKDKVALQLGEDEVLADLVLAADGAQSLISTKLANNHLQLDHHSAGLRQYYTGVDGFREGGFIELYFFRKIIPGYLWVFPLPEGQANVGIGMLSSALKRKKVNLRETMEELLTEHPLLKKRFAEAKQLEKPKGFGLPLGSARRVISGDEYLLLGDAAGLIDPFSGEGIANAIRSGRIAAEHISSVLQAGQKFSAEVNAAYADEIWRKTGPELKLSRQLQNLCKHSWLFDMICKKANKNATLQELLEDALAEVSVKKKLTSPGFYWNLLLS